MSDGQKKKSQQAQIDSLILQCRQNAQLIRAQQNYIDTFVNTPLWKRLVFWLDGWSAHEVVRQPKWRPWRRWWTS